MENTIIHKFINKCYGSNQLVIWQLSYSWASACTYTYISIATINKHPPKKDKQIGMISIASNCSHDAPGVISEGSLWKYLPPQKNTTEESSTAHVCSISLTSHPSHWTDLTNDLNDLTGVTGPASAVSDWPDTCRTDVQWNADDSCTGQSAGHISLTWIPRDCRNRLKRVSSSTAVSFHSTLKCILTYTLTL